MDGNPFLHMDIGLRTLFLAGVPVRIDQFYLVLLATLHNIMVAPNEHREITFLICLKPGSGAVRPVQLQLYDGDRLVASTTLIQ